MSLSIGTLIGQLIPLLIMLALIVVAIRFLLAATRLMNRKADEIESSVATRRRDANRTTREARATE